MTTIAIDGLNEEEFRRSIESRMRHGLAAEAANKLRTLLAPFAGPDLPLPERFLTVKPDDLCLEGWDTLRERIERHDRPGSPVTALSIAFGWPGEEVPEPDSQGRLSPLIEVGYYNDDAFPFSQSAREDLLEGYSYHGCTWTGDCEAIETDLTLAGIDDLHGALALLEARLLGSETPDEEEIRAGSLGACLLSVLLFQAVDARIAQDGLPRPLCVMSGSSGVYPYFDAPVAGIPEHVRQAAELAQAAVIEAGQGVPGPRYSSLLMTGIRRAPKRAVLVLEETTEAAAVRVASLRGLVEAEAEAPSAAADYWGETPPEPPAPGLPDLPAAPPPSLLLAKKPAGQAWDFREMLTPYKPGPARNPAAPIESTDEPLPELPAEPVAEFPPEFPPEEPLAEPSAAHAMEQEADIFEPPEQLELPEATEPSGAFEPSEEPGAFEAAETAEIPEAVEVRQSVERPEAIETQEAIEASEPFEPLKSLETERPHASLPLYLIDQDDEPEFRQPAAAEPVSAIEPAPAAALEPVPMAWPLGLDWLEQAEARLFPATAKLDQVAPDPDDGSTEPGSASMWTRLRGWLAVKRAQFRF